MIRGLSTLSLIGATNHVRESGIVSTSLSHVCMRPPAFMPGAGYIGDSFQCAMMDFTSLEFRTLSFKCLWKAFIFDSHSPTLKNF